MNKNIILLGMLLLIANYSFSQDGDRKKRSKEKLKAQKIAYITTELNLSSEESQSFWVVYNEHHQELRKVRNDIRKVKPSSDMSEEEATAVVNQSLEYAEKELQLKKAYIEKMKGVVSMKKIAKLQMVEKEFKRKMLGKIKDRYRSKNESRSQRDKRE